MALRGTNAKFERRFGYIEQALEAQGRSLETASLTEMDALWNEAKRKEKIASGHLSEPNQLAGECRRQSRCTPASPGCRENEAI